MSMNVLAQLSLKLAPNGVTTLHQSMRAIGLERSPKPPLKTLVNIAINSTGSSDALQPLIPSRKHPIALAFVVLVHLVLLVFMVKLSHSTAPLTPPLKPITVSLIAPPAPKVEPLSEIVPIVKPVVNKTETIKPQVVKPQVVETPKKVVEKLAPDIKPNERVFEATTEPIKTEPKVKEEARSEPTLATPAKVEEATVAKTEPADEKIELPKFGVAYLNNPAPEYPNMAKRAGEQGRVLLKVFVSESGHPETVEIEKSSGFDRLDQAALSAVKSWQFIPAKKGDKTISAYVKVPLKFSLAD
jgi:periplasmic protein TonB